MSPAGSSGPRGVRRLPDLRACGVLQMAIDDALLTEARWVTARRYLWAPPALSLGKHQEWPGSLPARTALDGCPGAALEVVRRPSGGRAVLHGEGFEWSFAVVFPAGDPRTRRVDDAYALVSTAMADALTASGVALLTAREEPYRRSSLCFATSLRHDLHTAMGKVVAVAQVRERAAALVHGSVLERRPPDELVATVERLTCEGWHGDGLAAAGVVGGERLWVSFLEALERRMDDT